jgi:large subunit ribosomal protein L25
VSDTTLVAEDRTEFGKGAARAVRRAKKVPAVLYGHGISPRHLSLPGHELMLALKHGGANALLTLKLGDGEQLALPKAVTRDPIKGFLEHVDLIVVRRGEKVTVSVPINLVGETTADVLVNHVLTELSVEAEATHIPTGFEVSVDGLEVGTTITASEVVLPAGTTLVTDPDAVVISAQAAPTAAQLDAELSEAAGEAAGDGGSAGAAEASSDAEAGSDSGDAAAE